MDAKAIERLQPRLVAFLEPFEDCFARSESWGSLGHYVRGQLSDLPRKSIEPIALASGVAPRCLQQFLADAKWDENRLRDKIQQRVAAGHNDPKTVGQIDETTYAKKGKKTPGIKRQYCGSTGKKDNCVVSVHLSCSAPTGFQSLLDAELFIPEDWAADRQRCREARIPEDMVYRPKWKIALELIDRSRGNGVRLSWVTFDEGYGNIPAFHADLDWRSQLYVGEVPKNFHGWCQPPEPLQKAHHSQLGRKLKSTAAAASRVDKLVCYSPLFQDQPWVGFYVKDSQKGPIVWEAKVGTFYISHNGVPGRPLLLMVARNALDRQEIKYFVSNGPPHTPTEELLRVGFSRFAIERCFEDEKTELGMDHFEVRNYVSLKRHLIISSLTLLFLVQVRAQDVKKNGTDGVPGAYGGQRHDSSVFHAASTTSMVA